MAVKKFGVILPHTRLYGGVKRFFEMGEVFIKRGHAFYVFTPDGQSPTWYSGSVKTYPMEEIEPLAMDVVFITETQFIPALVRSGAKRKVFYYVRPSDDLSVLRQYPEVELFSNSTDGHEVARKKYKIQSFKAFGGVNTSTYSPKVFVDKAPGEPIQILTYGRLVEKKKGTRIVVRACERLQRKGYNVKLILFDTPVNEKASKAIADFRCKVPFEFVVNHPVAQNAELFHRADIYVMAEKKAGHSNTTAEAMASGIPVVGTSSGTKDFLIDNVTGIVSSRWSWRIAAAMARLIDNPALQRQLAENGRKKIEEFNWDNLVDRILEHVDTTDKTHPA